MGRNVVIVESAAKAKTITKYLNSISELKDKGKFQVIASLGHIQDLPTKEIGVDISTWDATYVANPAKKKIIDKLKTAVQEADTIYLASDEDTEGEAIAWHLQNVLGLNKSKQKGRVHHRITFSEITKDALKKAILNPRQIDMDRVAAQESRRILDRVVGYELSPLLWRRFSTSSLSAGRVQSCVLKMLVDRATEIQEHEPEVYWIVDGVFETAGPVNTTLSAKAYQDGEIQTWDDEKDMYEWIQYIGKRVKKVGTDPWVAAFREGQSKKNPPAPFTTSTLQQEAYARLTIPSKRTMQLAQGLYEAGYITYMRTDSVAIAAEAQGRILDYVKEKYGKLYAQARSYKTKIKNAQEAHECIRVTDPYCKILPADEDFSASHRRLYELIWKRTVATQMTPAIYLDISYVITSKACAPLEFRGKTSFLQEEGYLKVYGYDKEQKEEESKISIDHWKGWLKKGQINVDPKEFSGIGDVTRPPSLFTEPTIVKAMEKEGIGRPSTFATIIDKLFEKGYVVKGPNPTQVVTVKTFYLKLPSTDVENTERAISIGGTDSDKLVPTSLGERVVGYLEPIVPFILDRKFTSSMEENLDSVMRGTTSKKKVLETFYKRFHPEVEKAQEQQKIVSAEKKKDDKEKDKVGKEEGPKNILKDFPNMEVQLVQTRFGPALFRKSDQKFVSVTPYLQWQKKTMTDLTEQDVRGLYNLPWKVPNTNREVAIGKYGLYLKDGKDNIRLPKELWQKAFDQRLNAQDIAGLKVYPQKEKEN